ncbi:MAG: sigma 54-interacting transcriptional regulator [Filomicrobium sp.]
MSSRPSIVGCSEALRHCLQYVTAVASSDAAVVILGESGVGKELIAERIHAESARAGKPLISVNCASVPRDLFESEFFGHAKGAFTGATRDRAGRFEAAHQGTLFLDEVGEIPAEQQGKLLRALQQSTFERVGEDRTRHVDVRVVAASNRNLADEVEAGRFRRDLFYRISTFMIEVPPLRDRKSDIRSLSEAFLREFAKRYRTDEPRLSKRDLDRLVSHDWPGNVRELKNVIERAFVLGKATGKLRVRAALDSPSPLAKTTATTRERTFLTAPELADFERQNFIAALEAAQWKIYGEGGAASLLELKPTTLASRLRSLGIKRPDKASLYSKLGGERFIAGLARDLLGRLQADPQLGRFWLHRSNLSLSREEKMLSRYLCSALGGPYRYDGGQMVEVHANLGITMGDWQVFLRHLHGCFDTFSIEDSVRQDLVALVNTLLPEIVTS